VKEHRLKKIFKNQPSCAACAAGRRPIAIPRQGQQKALADLFVNTIRKAREDSHG